MISADGDVIEEGIVRICLLIIFIVLIVNNMTLGCGDSV